MGTFLSTGIVIEMITLKEELKKAEIKNEELFSALEEKFHYNLNIFDNTETDEYLKFTLKDIVFQRELLPFLERLFPIIYGKDEEATKVIENLKAIEPSGWKKLAEQSPLYYYQLTKYGGDDWLYFEKGFDTRIRIKYPSIISLISEGIPGATSDLIRSFFGNGNQIRLKINKMMKFYWQWEVISITHQL